MARLEFQEHESGTVLIVLVIEAGESALLSPAARVAFETAKRGVLGHFEIRQE